MRRLVLALAAGLALTGCVSDEIDERRDELNARVDELKQRFEDEARQVRDDIKERVRDALEDLERAVPRAGPGTDAPSSDGGTEIERLLATTMESVDAYWEETFAANDVAPPRVGYAFIEEGRRRLTSCGALADDTAAFYCPVDDTIYIGEVLADGVYRGVLRGFPGQERGYGRAVGDFGVAYLVAHEYAHNVQQELGFFDRRRRGGQARPFELQADCLAGAWATSVYQAGKLQPGDVQEALDTALAVGDFEVGTEQHHGTPEERRDAWRLGFTSGKPGDCTAFVTGI